MSRSFYYNQKLDRWIDIRDGELTNEYHQFVMDEIELGGRAAFLIDDPDQAWWEIVGYPSLEAEKQIPEKHGRPLFTDDDFLMNAEIFKKETRWQTQ